MFQYLDEVKIIKGFYKGLEGRLTDERVKEDATFEYDVEILSKPNKNLPIIFKTVTVKVDYIENLITL